MSLVALILVSLAVFLLVIAGMAVGVMGGRPAIKGSCGGLGSGGCELCSGRCRRAAENKNDG